MYSGFAKCQSRIENPSHARKGIPCLSEPQVDKRNVFDEEVFTYQTNKDGKIFIFWRDKQVMILKDKSAQKFLTKIAGLDERQTQLVMAKLTGNFKHGNER